MLQSCEVLKIIVESQERYSSIAQVLQLRRKHWINLWRQNLHRDTNTLYFLFGEPGWVRSRNTVHQSSACSSTEVKYGPAAVAKSDGAYVLVLLSQPPYKGKDFGLTDLFAMAGCEAREIEGSSFGWVFAQNIEL